MGGDRKKKLGKKKSQNTPTRGRSPPNKQFCRLKTNVGPKKKKINPKRTGKIAFGSN